MSTERSLPPNHVMAPGKVLALHTKYASDADVMELLHSHDTYRRAYSAASWALAKIDVDGVRKLQDMRWDVDRGERQSFNCSTWEVTAR